jgi:hypothetical protein
MTPLLASLARLVARGLHVSEDKLALLLSGVDLDTDRTAQVELLRWTRMLQAVHDDPGEETRHIVTEALLLRDLPEAAVLLAVATAAGQAVTATPEVPRLLSAQPSRLEWTLEPGQGVADQLTVQGGPGHVVVGSDQVQVKPGQFGAEPTQLQVLVHPLREGLLWSSVKLVTSRATLEVPLVVQWVTYHPALAPNVVAPILPPREEPKPDQTRAALHSLPACIVPRSCPQCGRASTASNNHCAHCGAWIPLA